MKYTDKHGQVKTFTPVDDWRYSAGYWVDKIGQSHNLTEMIAKSGGTLTPESKQERKIMSIALNYAKQRRERSLLALQREVANLDEAISKL